MNADQIKEYGKSEWQKVFSGYWGLLTCNHLGYEHSRLIRERFGHGPHKAIIVSQKGRCACHYEKKDLEEFGKNLADSVIKDSGLMERWSKTVKQNTDILLDFIKRQSDDLESMRKNYSEFLRTFHEYPSAYVALKQALNFLPKELYNKYLSLCDETRLYSENLYTETEKFMRRFAEGIGKETDYDADLILSCTGEEFEVYLEKGFLPDRSVLKERFESNALIFEDGVLTLITGKDVKELENQLIGSLEVNEVKGAVAFRGIVRGKVRIVLDPFKVKQQFDKGDILVTGMTRPEYLHLMEKSGAVVTDAGGILCHAAVVARELKKPTVIGTEKATKVFKDGDYVEVDANTGIIRKINQ